jgi:hypothetical protein
LRGEVGDNAIALSPGEGVLLSRSPCLSDILPCR